MKITYCIHGLSNSGGMERMISEKANWLAEHGHIVTILTTEQRDKNCFFNLNSSIRINNLGIGYSYIKSGSIVHTAICFRSKKKQHLCALKSFLKDNPQDIVISTFGNEVDLLPQVKDESRKIVEIHFSHGYRKKENRRGIWRLIAKLRSIQDMSIVRKYDKFVVLTEEDMNDWKGLINICVIPNFTNSACTTADLSEKRAIAVGRLSHQKGFDDLIEVWRMVAQTRPDWHLDIFGDGSLLNGLNDMITALELNDSVTIHPATKKIKDEYLNSSLYLMTSHYEGLPMTLIEAMNFGLIPISFACKCGPRDLIGDNNYGFLIENRDKDEMAHTILQIIDNIEAYRQIGYNAHKRITQEYSPEVVMQRWLSLFDEVLAKNLK